MDTVHNTRHSVKYGENFGGKTERSQRSFCYRGVVTYNRLPLDIINTEDMEAFKRKLKHWIKTNVPIG